MKDYIIFDAHCDTISKIYEEKEELYSNSFHVDLERLEKYKHFTQIFAICIDNDYFAKNIPFKHTLRILQRFNEEISKNAEKVALVRSFSDMTYAAQSGKTAAFLSIEGGEAFEGDISLLRIFYNLGVRIVTLTWNRRNEIGDGVGIEGSKHGLSSFGREVLREMNSLGMLIDISHINESGFWDVVQYSNKPFIASHSNSQHICNNKRNLSDEQFKALINVNGVAGINLCDDFLRDGGNSTISDIIKHIEHFMSLGGENNIGFGFDFDGIDNLPCEIKGVEDIYKIIDELSVLGYSETIIDKITHKNFYRIVNEIMK